MNLVPREWGGQRKTFQGGAAAGSGDGGPEGDPVERGPNENFPWIGVAAAREGGYGEGVKYFDSNATTPLLPEVLEAMWPWLERDFYNPSGAYEGARRARRAIEESREKVAALIGAKPEEIVFTGGGTESTNTALKWLARWVGRKSGRVITSAIEHRAVLRPCETFEEVGYAVEKVGVDGGGRLLVEAWEEACEAAREGGGFASLMWVNNETGVVQPVEAACEAAKSRGLAFHTDAIQAAGKVPVRVDRVPVDFLSMSAHKFHGPKGVGVLYVRDGVRFEPLLRGGGQEGDRRSGTENVAGIVGMGVAAELAMGFLERPAELARLRDRFEEELLAKVEGAMVHGDREHRLPGTTYLSFEGCEAAGLLILLDDMGVACSAGSACTTGKQKPSHVALAMGLSEERAKSCLRFGFSRLNREEEIMEGVECVRRAVEKLRRVQGHGVGPVVVYSP